MRLACAQHTWVPLCLRASSYPGSLTRHPPLFVLHHKSWRTAVSIMSLPLRHINPSCVHAVIVTSFTRAHAHASSACLSAMTWLRSFTPGLSSSDLCAFKLIAAQQWRHDWTAPKQRAFATPWLHIVSIAHVSQSRHLNAIVNRDSVIPHVIPHLLCYSHMSYARVLYGCTMVVKMMVMIAAMIMMRMVILSRMLRMVIH